MEFVQRVCWGEVRKVVFVFLFQIFWIKLRLKFVTKVYYKIIEKVDYIIIYKYY